MSFVYPSACTRGCAATPTRPSCPIPVQERPYEYRAAETSLPRVLCLGDSVGGPSCQAAASHPLVAGKLEVRAIQFMASGNRTVLLNTFGSANLQRCLGTWLSGVCKHLETRYECPAPTLRWKGVVMGAGAWDLQCAFGIPTHAPCNACC